jgi:hypothetical protein
MPRRMTVPMLASLEPRDYVESVRSRLGDDEDWVILLDPRLEARTRWAVDRIITSIDRQIEKIGDTDPSWKRRVTALRRLAVHRQRQMVPVEAVPLSNTREARDWRDFAALLARVLGEIDPAALQRLQAPYGALSAAEWLERRNAKKQKQEVA